jgi:hypothetical protein
MNIAFHHHMRPSSNGRTPAYQAANASSILAGRSRLSSMAPDNHACIPSWLSRHGGTFLVDVCVHIVSIHIVRSILSPVTLTYMSPGKAITCLSRQKAAAWHKASHCHHPSKYVGIVNAPTMPLPVGRLMISLSLRCGRVKAGTQSSPWNGLHRVVPLTIAYLIANVMMMVECHD